MLRVRLPHQHESSLYHTNTKPDTSCIFSWTEPPRRVDAWSRYGRIFLFQEHNRRNAVQERQRDLALLQLLTYPLSCTDVVGILIIFS